MLTNAWHTGEAAGHLSPLCGTVQLRGALECAVRLVEERQLLNASLWTLFAQQFRLQTDRNDNGWRGEYWGKMMRGGCLVYSYTKNQTLYEMLEKSVRDILTATRPDGVLSTYLPERELCGWDVWSRKYILLGMQYFCEICDDTALKATLTDAMMRQADDLLAKIGADKIDICATSSAWGGINSCSVLEPIVRLYNSTGKKRYLDFASYIVAHAGGTTEDDTIFGLALADKLDPHEYPVNKAYETMSCFEGLLEYYYVTGNEKYKTAVCNFVNRIARAETTIIGCCGCNGEQFDGAAKTQVYPVADLMQETCVTVTWMKLCSRALAMDGNAAYAEEIERSLFNAMLGAVNTKNTPENGGLPFDSYSPLLYGTRAKGIGGMRVMENGKFYGCCAAIGAAGLGVAARTAVMQNAAGLVFLLYQTAEISAVRTDGSRVAVTVDTQYPYDETVVMRLSAATDFAVTLRIPAWCRGAQVTLNGGEAVALPAGQYATLRRDWADGDVLCLRLPMETTALVCDKHVAFRRGPVVLARDKRFDAAAGTPIACGTVPSCDTPCAAENVLESTEVVLPPDDCNARLALTLRSGARLEMIDYASAGKTWNDQSACEAWICSAE